jgi:fumarylacetoacetase
MTASYESRRVDATHDPAARSWIVSANGDDCDFPVQNLPYGVFSHGDNICRVGVAIGDQVLDLGSRASAGLYGTLDAQTVQAIGGESLNDLMALGPARWSALRHHIFKLLHERAAASVQAAVQSCLVPMAEVSMLMPAEIGDYTDFYASVFHATNVGLMFRPDNPLLPNYKWVPIAYHGRASSIVVSGAAVPRPSGQTKAEGAAQPEFGPTQRLDYELEVGLFVGPGNESGKMIPIAKAGQQIFGMCLLNDWSARDLQAWEYQPLGPFLAKNFLTSISPWVVTVDALGPFRVPAFTRPKGDPAPLPYLSDLRDQRSGGFDITLEVHISTAKMRAAKLPPHRLSLSSFRDMYWTAAQMIAHHASNGCNLRPGDLIGSGTVSGPAKDSRGCLLELTWRGTEPVLLPGWEEKRFLEEGDEVIIRGWCERPGFRRIGFGECRGMVAG